MPPRAPACSALVIPSALWRHADVFSHFDAQQPRLRQTRRTTIILLCQANAQRYRRLIATQLRQCSTSVSLLRGKHTANWAAHRRQSCARRHPAAWAPPPPSPARWHFHAASLMACCWRPDHSLWKPGPSDRNPERGSGSIENELLTSSREGLDGAAVAPCLTCRLLVALQPPPVPVPCRQRMCCVSGSLVLHYHPPDRDSTTNTQTLQVLIRCLDIGVTKGCLAGEGCS